MTEKTANCHYQNQEPFYRGRDLPPWHVCHEPHVPFIYCEMARAEGKCPKVGVL